jgi:hypothetical protein
MANPTKNPHGGPPDQHGHDGRHDGGEHGHSGDNPQISFERKDVNIVQITGFGIGLLIAFMVTVFAMYALFAYFASREDKVNPPNPPAMMSERPEMAPLPRLQPEPLQELKQLRDNEEMLLMSYGWVDQNKGIVHIPIDQAIGIVAGNIAAQKGLAVKVSPAGSANEGFRMIPSDASGGRTLEKISQ